MKRLLMMAVPVCVLAFTGCVTSPFLNEDAAKRMAAVDALSEQRKLVEVALDYCTEPYQKLPTGCQMDVRRRAVERLSDRDLLMAVASFSIVKATIKGRSCLVTLGEPNAELRKLALEKLTEDRYISSVLAATDPFAIQSLFKKALFGYYQIVGQHPETAKDAWFELAKVKEKSVARAFCGCLDSDAPTELCQQVFALFPTAISSDTKNSIKSAYKRAMTRASSVNAAVRVLQLAAIVPADAVVKDNVDAMCKRICSTVSTGEEFKAFMTLVNGEYRKYLSDPKSLIKDAATRVIANLNGINELATFAEVLQKLDSPWIGQIGIENEVRKCAASINNISSIKIFAKQLASFNTIMLPNKADIAGATVISVLNAIVEGRAIATLDGEKETIDDFVNAVNAFSADFLSDEAIIAIFKNESLNNAYRRAIRSDGYRDDMGNEIAGTVIKNGSFENMIAAGLLLGAMGEKESPKYTKMFAHLVSILRTPEAFIAASGYAKIYYSQRLLIEEVEKRMDDMTLAKCLLAIYENSPKSEWCVNKILTVGERFALSSKEEELAILQPVYMRYAKVRNLFIRMSAISCLTSPEYIEENLVSIKFSDLIREDLIREDEKVLKAYTRAVMRASSLYTSLGKLDKCLSFQYRISDLLASGVGNECRIFCQPDFPFPNRVAPIMQMLSQTCPKVWALIMMKARIPPCSIEFTKLSCILSNHPETLIEFIDGYSCAPYSFSRDTPKRGSFNYGVKGGKYYYNCDWYWKILCEASALELTDLQRTKLNAKMKFFALNAEDLDKCAKVVDAMKGDKEKKEILDIWENANAEIPKKATEFFNFCLDDSMTKVKKEKEWRRRFADKRIRLRGKIIDCNNYWVNIDGSDDIKDKKFANALPPEYRDIVAQRYKNRQVKENDKIIMIYSVSFSEEWKDRIAELNKGEEVVFEAFPLEQVFRNASTFNCKLGRGRFIIAK